MLYIILFWLIFGGLFYMLGRHNYDNPKTLKQINDMHIAIKSAKDLAVNGDSSSKDGENIITSELGELLS